MTAGPLDALADNAPEEDPDSDRHKIEAAVLATVYREGMTAPGLWRWRPLTWSCLTSRDGKLCISATVLNDRGLNMAPLNKGGRPKAAEAYDKLSICLSQSQRS